MSTPLGLFAGSPTESALFRDNPGANNPHALAQHLSSISPSEGAAILERRFTYEARDTFDFLIANGFQDQVKSICLEWACITRAEKFFAVALPHIEIPALEQRLGDSPPPARQCVALGFGGLLFEHLDVTRKVFQHLRLDPRVKVLGASFQSDLAFKRRVRLMGGWVKLGASEDRVVASVVERFAGRADLRPWIEPLIRAPSPGWERAIVRVAENAKWRPHLPQDLVAVASQRERLRHSVSAIPVFATP